MSPRRSNIILWRLKRSQFSRKIDKKLVKTSPPRLFCWLTFETFTHAVERIGQDLIQIGMLVAFWGTLWGQSWCCGDPKHVLFWEKSIKKSANSNILQLHSLAYELSTRQVSSVSTSNELCTTPLNNRENTPFGNIKCAYSSARNSRPKEPLFPCVQSLIIHRVFASFVSIS